MPADINPFRNYTPRNQLQDDWQPNRRMEVGGYYSTTTTTHITESYHVKITYEGPVNIGERIIVSRNIPNYWADYSVQAEARTEMEKASPPIDCAFLLCIPCKLVYWVLCCPCAYSSYSEDVNRKYNQYLDIVANRRMEQDIVTLLKDADEQVSERIAHEESSSTRMPTTTNPYAMYQSAPPRMPPVQTMHSTDPSQQPLLQPQGTEMVQVSGYGSHS